MTSMLWQIPIAALISVVLVRLLLSPFLIYRKRDKEGRIAEEKLGQAEKALRATPPAVRPHGYGKSADETSHGLTITNGGYLAFDVHIPPVLLEPSRYTLTFPEILTQLGERDHQRFICG
jgi:hypothetical protein